MAKGYIYIMTNPALKNMVKIGYSTDVEKRRQDLSHSTSIPDDYQIYATYETEGKLEDKKLHHLIDKLNPDIRYNPKKEFYIMSPEDAYYLLEAIEYISGTTGKLKRHKNNDSNTTMKKPQINFAKCGIPIGAELVFIEDTNIKVTVVSEKKVEYKGEEISLSTLAQELKHLKSKPQGTAFFMYNGRPLIDIANETQWK